MFDYQPTVLIIEDDDYIRRFVRQALKARAARSMRPTPSSAA